MKTAILLTVLLAASINTVKAEEAASDSEDIKIYCTEQAQLAGIEEAEELNQYVKDCIDSYAGPTGE